MRRPAAAASCVGGTETGSGTGGESESAETQIPVRVHELEQLTEEEREAGIDREELRPTKEPGVRPESSENRKR